jgi:aerobic carbon-monoxide dehydrogenase medium subunit
MTRFDYFEPSDLDELTTLLSRYGDQARIIAGGQSLLILVRQGLVRPKVLISLDNISSLKQIARAQHGLLIGAMVTQSQIAAEPQIINALAVLAQAASKVGSVHVQNLGTVGGNLCHAEPNGDSAPALLSLGASVIALSSRGKRNIPLEDFFRGPFENVLEPDEVLIHIDVPFPEPRASSIYLKHVLRGVDRAIVSVGIMMQLENGDYCREIRIGLGGGAATPRRFKEAERVLRGKKITDSAIESVGIEVLKSCDPLSDSHGPAEYKRKMAGTITRRAIRQIVSSNASKKEV